MGLDHKTVSVVVLDDYMGTGSKAKYYLESLQKAGFVDYGFAALVGPAIFHTTSQTIDQAKDFILRKSQLAHELQSRLFFSGRKDDKLWELVKAAAELSCDYTQLHREGKVGLGSRFAELEQFFDELARKVSERIEAG